MRELRHLNLTSPQCFADVSPLSGLTQLTHLDLTCSAVSDLSPLAGLARLETLLLGGCR